MGKLKCRCGHVISNSEHGVSLQLYTEREWLDIIQLGKIDPIDLPEPEYDAWRCPMCERVYIFKDGEQEAFRVYTLEPNHETP